MAAKTLRVTYHEACSRFLRAILALTQVAGIFAGTVGVRRLLKLFDKYKIKTTWFIPGHSLDTFREECGMIRDAGHEMYTKSVGSSCYES